MRTYLDGEACVGHLVELPDGRDGYVLSVAGPGTVWVLIGPDEETHGTTEAHTATSLKPYEEV